MKSSAVVDASLNHLQQRPRFTRDSQSGQDVFFKSKRQPKVTESDWELFDIYPDGDLDLQGAAAVLPKNVPLSDAQAYSGLDREFAIPKSKKDGKTSATDSRDSATSSHRSTGQLEKTHVSSSKADFWVHQKYVHNLNDRYNHHKVDFTKQNDPRFDRVPCGTSAKVWDKIGSGTPKQGKRTDRPRKILGLGEETTSKPQPTTHGKACGICKRSS